MNAIDASAKVLAEAGKPLSYREITHEQGLIITTSDFSKGAREEAARPNAVPVGLMDGEQLVRLFVENNIGVQRTSYELIELG